MVTPIIVVLNDKERWCREAVASILKSFGSSAVEPLLTALMDENEEIRNAAANLLDELGWLPVQDANGVAYWVIRKAWTKCFLIGSQAVEPLIAALKKW